MGNWYSSRTVSIANNGYKNASLDDGMINGTNTLKKQRNAIKKPAVISALVRSTCSKILHNFIVCESV